MVRVGIRLALGRSCRGMEDSAPHQPLFLAGRRMIVRGMDADTYILITLPLLGRRIWRGAEVVRIFQLGLL